MSRGHRDHNLLEGNRVEVGDGGCKPHYATKKRIMVIFTVVAGV